jgi:hypothetical protein
MPLAGLFIIYSSLVVYLTYERTLLPEKFGIKMNLFLIATSLLFGYSYIRTILTGPGYLPFYFPYTNPNIRDRSADVLSGMITNSEQEFYLRTVTLPPRTAFFRGARRIVIRPDHFCLWTECFVGKKNEKLFFLFNLWGMIYISGFTIATLRTVIAISGDRDVRMQLNISVMYLILGVSFGFLTTSFACAMLYELSFNETTFDGVKTGRKGLKVKECVKNWEEVFGPREKWYLWLVPVPAFPVKDDRMLLATERARVGQSSL